MLVDLVRTTTPDGMRLDGILHAVPGDKNATFEQNEQHIWLTSIATHLGGAKQVDEGVLPQGRERFPDGLPEGGVVDRERGVPEDEDEAGPARRGEVLLDAREQLGFAVALETRECCASRARLCRGRRIGAQVVGGDIDVLGNRSLRCSTAGIPARVSPARPGPGSLRRRRRPPRVLG